MHHNHSKTLPGSDKAIKNLYKKNSFSDYKKDGLKLFAVYPDYWKREWGEPPLLGHVKETSEYWAKYAAYDNKLLPYNATFGPKVVQVDSPVRQPIKRKYGYSNKIHQKG